MVLGAESTKLQLANAGDEVVVKDQSGSVIDETAYSDAREQEDKSWARIPNGSREFSFTSQVTKGAKNPMTKENGASVTLGSTTTPVSKPKLRLSEVYACPTSGESEWVEIVNEGTDGFDGIVKIKDAANNVLSFEIHIKAHELLALESSRQILNNTGDSVELVVEPFGTLDSMSYEKCEMGMSLVFGGGSWQLTTSVTWGGANILSQPTSAKVEKSPTSAVSPQQSPLPQVLGEAELEQQMIEEDIDEEATVPAQLKPADDFRNEEDEEERMGEQVSEKEQSMTQSPGWWLMGSGFFFILSGIAPFLKELVGK